MTQDSEEPLSPFIDGLDGGYVWDPRARSVGNKPLSVPLKDGEHDHMQNALEYLQVAFGRAHPTEKQLEQQADSAYHRAIQRAQRDVDPADILHQRVRLGRGGYR